MNARKSTHFVEIKPRINADYNFNNAFTQEGDDDVFGFTLKSDPIEEYFCAGQPRSRVSIHATL